jgi:hypothetical protein
MAPARQTHAGVTGPSGTAGSVETFPAEVHRPTKGTADGTSLEGKAAAIHAAGLDGTDATPGPAASRITACPG